MGLVVGSHEKAGKWRGVPDQPAHRGGSANILNCTDEGKKQPIKSG